MDTQILKIIEEIGQAKRVGTKMKMGQGQINQTRVRTREQLMLMTLEPKEQQVYSQKQPSRKTVENIDGRAKVHGNNQEKAGTEEWEGTNGNLALDLEPNQVSNTSQSQD